MSLSRKSSRAIDVDGTTYRWTFTVNDGWSDIIVQIAGGNGAKLCLRTSWMDTGIPAPAQVTPADVASGIRFSLKNGWIAEQSGATFVLKISDGKYLPK